MEPSTIEGFEPKRAMKMDGPGNGRGDRGDIRRDAHKPGGRGGFKPRDDRGSFNDRGPRTERTGGFQARDGARDDNRGNRDSAARPSNAYAGRSDRPTDDRPRQFSDRPSSARPQGDRPQSDRPTAGAPNRSFGDSIAFGKKPYSRDNASAPRGDSNRDSRGNRQDANRGDNRVLGARYEGRNDAARADRSAAPQRRDSARPDSRPARANNDTRSFGNANAGSNAPRRPRSFA